MLQSCSWFRLVSVGNPLLTLSLVLRCSARRVFAPVAQLVWGVCVFTGSNPKPPPPPLPSLPRLLTVTQKDKSPQKLNHRAWAVSRETNILGAAGNCKALQQSLAALCGPFCGLFEFGLLFVYVHIARKNQTSCILMNAIQLFPLYDPRFKIKAPRGALGGSDDRRRGESNRKH